MDHIKQSCLVHSPEEMV